MPKKFWQFRNQAAGSAELLLYGDISDSSWWGDEVTPKTFADELNALGALTSLAGCGEHQRGHYPASLQGPLLWRRVYRFEADYMGLAGGRHAPLLLWSVYPDLHGTCHDAG